jgi:CheY-like chemotaxis protein
MRNHASIWRGEDRSTVLLVDPDEDTRLVFRTYFEHLGFAVLVAGDPEGGLQLARERLPDVVVCELAFARGERRSFARSLREDPVTAAIPVVVVTAYRHATEAIAAVAADGSRVVFKPCGPTELAEIVRAECAGPRHDSVCLRIASPAAPAH